MRYSTENQLREIMLRGSRLRRHRSRQLTGLLSGTGMCLAVAVVASVSVFSGAATPYLSDSAYGAFLLGSKSGSYVLCGVAAFVCGALFTAACIRGRRKPEEKKAESVRATRPDYPKQSESTRI